jgi:hypothetical protein
MHPECPVGWRGKAVAVGNILYWITDDVHLLACDLDLDLWLIGNLKGLNFRFEFEEPALPGFIHLEDQRFCIIQRTSESDAYIDCILFDVSPMPEKKKLRISIVSTIKYKTKTWTHFCITDCLLL